jgi:hypothetical protein
MNFINPIEILELQSFDIATIDSTVIKKAKKKLLTEIDFADGQIDYKGIKITKTDCERVIDELSDKDRKEYYYYLANSNIELNNFLAIGDEKIFTSFKQESIYKLPDFINFISPYFVSYFDKSLLRALKNENTSLFNSTFRAKSLINQTDINAAYKSVSHELQNRIADIDKIRHGIKKGETKYNEETIVETLGIIKSNFPVEIINSLPLYFQSQINKIAESVNYLQLAIWDKYYNTQLPCDMLEYILQFNIESVSKPTFENNYEIVKAKNAERIEQEKYLPVLKKWATVLSEIRDLTKQVEEKVIEPKRAYKSVSKVVDINELNSLDLFADEVRDQICYSIRSLSISSWNVQEDIDTSLSLIGFASKIEITKETREKINEDLKKLKEIKEEREARGEPIDSAPSLRTINGVGTKIYDDTLYFVFFFIPIIPLARYRLEETNQGYRFFAKLKLHRYQQIWQWVAPIGIILLIIISSSQH